MDGTLIQEILGAIQYAISNTLVVVLMLLEVVKQTDKDRAMLIRHVHQK